MAAAYSFQGFPRSPRHAILAQSVDGISRTCRIITAGVGQKKALGNLKYLHQIGGNCDSRPLDYPRQVHYRAWPVSFCVCARSPATISFRLAPERLSGMGRSMITTPQPFAGQCVCVMRNDSFKRRFSRLRTQALPTFFRMLTANRVGPGGLGQKYKRNHPPSARRPWLIVARISSLRVKRTARGQRARRGVTGADTVTSRRQ